jgi:CheY-like chemotaxis protein
MLQLETANVELDEDYCGTHPPTQPGKYIMLSVSDTGTGIAKADLPHIFDPFFTTKELGKGTGVGLSIVYGIVKQSGGYVWVYSEPGHGATFKLYFPVTDRASEQFAQRAGVSGQADGQTILVVEDDATIRANVGRCLQHLGYRALEAGSGEAALAMCNQNHGEIDLVMTDLVMPGLGGHELAAQLRSHFPEMRILFTSGYTEDSAVRRGLMELGNTFLEKPYTVAALSNAVQEALVKRYCPSEAEGSATG